MVINLDRRKRTSDDSFVSIVPETKRLYLDESGEKQVIKEDLPAGGQFPVVPDIIEFVTSPFFLNKPGLFPRQATLLKIIFLQDELFTDYDYEVIEEWMSSEFYLPDEPPADQDAPYVFIGQHGLPPDIYERIKINKAEGRKWFREIVAIIGRRGSKGFLGACCGAYVMWNYIATLNPQDHYGVEQAKRLTAFVFAGKKDQAKANQWKDIDNVLKDAPCFIPFLGKPLGESITIKAPHDEQRQRQRMAQGLPQEDIATFEVLPKESTLISGRGPASFMQFYDEMAHIQNTGANRSAEDVYNCLDPKTPVLCADLVWRPICDVGVGDNLIGFDEYAAPGKQRKLRSSQVLGKVINHAPVLRITFDDGSFVECSPHHQWLRMAPINNGNGNAIWVTAGKVPRIGSYGNPTHLKVGDRIRWIVDPWEVDQSHEGGWLAGMFDGEGFISAPKTSSFQVALTQNPGPVLDRVMELLKENDFDFFHYLPHKSHISKSDVVGVRGIAGLLRLLGQFRPLRLLEKAQGVWEGKAPRGYKKYKTIVAIDEVGFRDLVDIETSTKTFIANGFVSHNSSTPALDQFGEDAFIYEGSSPWQMMGQFYLNAQKALEVDRETHSPVYPEMLVVQLTSWDIYVDWEKAHEIPMTSGRTLVINGQVRCGLTEHFRRKRRAIQAYDDKMKRLERANPQTFSVERRARWQSVMDHYLNEAHIRRMWAPFHEISGELDPDPQVRELAMQRYGRLNINYVAHADPSKSGDGFGFAIGHREGPDQNGFYHVVFDLLKAWLPSDYEYNNYEIDYLAVEQEMKEYLDRFMPGILTFDQWNSVASIQHLRQYVNERKFPKQIVIDEKTATRTVNWRMAEGFKTALGLDLIHAPFHDLADMELRFLQDKGGKIDHPDTGPIQSKDVADAMFNVTDNLIGAQMVAFLSEELGALRLGGAAAGGLPLASDVHSENVIFEGLSHATARGRHTNSGMPSNRRPSTHTPGNVGARRGRGKV